MNQTDYTDEETKAFDAASDRAGEYLDALGKTDMAQFTEEEWFDLLAAVVQGWCEFFEPKKTELEQLTDDEIPF